MHLPSLARTTTAEERRTNAYSLSLLGQAGLFECTFALVRLCVLQQQSSTSARPRAHRSRTVVVAAVVPLVRPLLVCLCVCVCVWGMCTSAPLVCHHQTAAASAVDRVCYVLCCWCDGEMAKSISKSPPSSSSSSAYQVRTLLWRGAKRSPPAGKTYFLAICIMPSQMMCSWRWSWCSVLLLLLLWSGKLLASPSLTKSAHLPLHHHHMLHTSQKEKFREGAERSQFRRQQQQQQMCVPGRQTKEESEEESTGLKFSKCEQHCCCCCRCCCCWWSNTHKVLPPGKRQKKKKTAELCELCDSTVR